MIYIIHEQTNDNFKIGYTKSDPIRRLQSCRTHCPYPVSLLGTFPGDMKKEKMLHERFFPNRTRYNGEWFHTDKKEMVSLIMEEGGKLYEEAISKKTEKSSLELIKKLFLKCEEQEKQIAVLEKQLLDSRVGSDRNAMKQKFDFGIIAAMQKESSASFAVYCFLLTNADARNEVSIGTTKIAETCGCARGTVHKAVATLIKYELLEVKNKSQGQKAIYKVLL